MDPRAAQERLPPGEPARDTGLPGGGHCGRVHDRPAPLVEPARVGGERQGVGEWTVNQWVKKAVLLSFRLSENRFMQSGELAYFDKVEPKFSSGSEAALRAGGHASSSGRTTPTSSRTPAPRRTWPCSARS